MTSPCLWQGNPVQHHKLCHETMGSGKHNGLIAHGNWGLGPDLPLNMFAVQWAPCACDGCLDQLCPQWEKSIKDLKFQAHCQPVSGRCNHHQMFGLLNDWNLRKLNMHKEGDHEELEETHATCWGVLDVSERNAKETKRKHLVQSIEMKDSM